MDHYPVILPLLFALLLPACKPEIVFEKHYEIPNGEWSYADTLDFKVNIRDTLAIYDLYLKLKHSRDYPFENMYVRIHTGFPDGQRLTEQVSLELAAGTGIWNGDCNRKGCRISIPIQEGAYFDQAGTYTFTLEQFTRRDTLPGVEEITFAIEDTGKSRGK